MDFPQQQLSTLLIPGFVHEHVQEFSRSSHFYNNLEALPWRRQWFLGKMTQYDVNGLEGLNSDFEVDHGGTNFLHVSVLHFLKYK